MRRASTRPWFLRSRGRWLAFVGGLFLASLGCFAGTLWWAVERRQQEAVRVVRHADLHHLALQAAEADPRVVALLGSPLQAAALELGRHGRTTDGARVDFSFEVSGPLGRGRMRAQALWPRAEEGWRLVHLELAHAGGALELRASPDVER
ncbi:MAG: cytochrome c oxidase assembly factor 1 family protein [Myxococcaceae bacterium]|nr:cytochrome c oxidase assembly factor 1 family protein [Myxococcaceae bacterium]MCI0669048.1 cytochrome c oxidase assembly factor 1 family protein [Myxococcaceae bacterium]